MKELKFGTNIKWRTVYIPCNIVTLIYVGFVVDEEALGQVLQLLRCSVMLVFYSSAVGAI